MEPVWHSYKHISTKNACVKFGTVDLKRRNVIFFLLFRLYLFLDKGLQRRMPSLGKIGLMILEMSVFKICVQ